MLLSEIKNIFHKELDAMYDKNEVSSFFYLLLEHYLGLERFVLSLQPDLTMEKHQEPSFFKALSELKLQKPIQHIIGYTHFMDLQFKVGPEVLIPRPETEELVRWILEDCQAGKSDDAKEPSDAFIILDIGTGSGCIPISLAKHLKNARVSALDLSIKALEVAKVNALANDVVIHFFEADILNTTNWPLEKSEQKFHIIVSNPPYVRVLEKKEIHKNVLAYEPGMALFVPDDNPLKFYGAIAAFAQEHLADNGSLYIEINQYLGKETADLLENYTFKNISLRKDMFGNDRMIKATKE